MKEINLSKDGVWMQYYRSVWSDDLPSDTCEYRWKGTIAVLILPLYIIPYLITVGAGFIVYNIVDYFKKDKGHYTDESWKRPILVLVFVLIFFGCIFNIIIYKAYEKGNPGFYDLLSLKEKLWMVVTWYLSSALTGAIGLAIISFFIWSFIGIWELIVKSYKKMEQKGNDYIDYQRSQPKEGAFKKYRKTLKEKYCSKIRWIEKEKKGADCSDYEPN